MATSCMQCTATPFVFSCYSAGYHSRWPAVLPTRSCCAGEQCICVAHLPGQRSGTHQSPHLQVREAASGWHPSQPSTNHLDTGRTTVPASLAHQLTGKLFIDMDERVAIGCIIFCFLGLIAVLCACWRARRGCSSFFKWLRWPEPDSEGQHAMEVSVWRGFAARSHLDLADSRQQQSLAEAAQLTSAQAQSQARVANVSTPMQVNPSAMVKTAAMSDAQGPSQTQTASRSVVRSATTDSEAFRSGASSQRVGASQLKGTLTTLPAPSTGHQPQPCMDTVVLPAPPHLSPAEHQQQTVGALAAVPIQQQGGWLHARGAQMQLAPATALAPLQPTAPASALEPPTARAPVPLAAPQTLPAQPTAHTPPGPRLQTPGMPTPSPQQAAPTRRIVPSKPGTCSTLGISHFTTEQPLTRLESNARDELCTALSNWATATPPKHFATRFMLVDEQVQGGQAVVQFARDDSRFYAIKCAPTVAAVFTAVTVLAVCLTLRWMV